MNEARATDGDRECDRADPPGSLSGDDLETWRQLTQAEREKAWVRIDALERWRRLAEGHGHVRVGEAGMLAASVGLSRKRFYEIASLWMQSGSLEALGIGIPPRVSTSTGGNTSSRKEIAVAGMEQLMQDGGGMGTEALLAALREEGKDGGASRATLLRWLSALRSTRASVLAVGGSVYLDHVYLPTADGGSGACVMCALGDRATGLILGWSIRPVHSLTAGYRSAARHGLGFLSETEVPVFVADEEPVSVEIFTSSGMDHEPMLRMMSALSGMAVQRNGDAVRMARPLFRRLQGKIDRLKVTPRAAIVGESEAVDPRFVEEIVGRVIDEGNDRLLRQIMPFSAPPGWASGRERLTSMLAVLATDA